MRILLTVAAAVLVLVFLEAILKILMVVLGIAIGVMLIVWALGFYDPGTDPYPDDCCDHRYD